VPSEKIPDPKATANCVKAHGSEPVDFDFSELRRRSWHINSPLKLFAIRENALFPVRESRCAFRFIAVFRDLGAFGQSARIRNFSQKSPAYLSVEPDRNFANLCGSESTPLAYQTAFCTTATKRDFAARPTKSDFVGPYS
jgi:hypothetical protein